MNHEKIEALLRECYPVNVARMINFHELSSFNTGTIMPVKMADFGSLISQLLKSRALNIQNGLKNT